MSKSKIFIAVCISFAVGVFLASFLQIPVGSTVGILGFSLAVFSLGVINGSRKIYLPALMLVFLGLGILRLQYSLVENEYTKLFGLKQELEGYVVEDPDIRPDRQLLTVQPDGFRQRILVTTTKSWDYFYGDRVVVIGRPNEPKAYEDFDYKRYLQRYEVYALVSYPKILVLKTGQLNPVKYRLLKFKQSFVKNLSGKFKEPQDSLLLGILIGAKKTLPEDLVKNFQATGLSHIVAVSGYNITILASFLGLAAYLFGRRVSFWFSLLAIFAFAVVAGWSASVVRAAIMGAVLLLGFQTGRPYAAGPGICLAGVLMISLNPRVLFWDVGFQLSFLATLGIVYGLPLLEKIFRTEIGVTGLKAATLSSLAAIVATLPLSLMQFGRLPAYALLANLLVLPLVPYVMLFGFLSLTPFFGPGFAFITQLLLNYIVWIVKWVAVWPGAVRQVSLTPLVVLGLYLVVFSGYFVLERKIRPG